MLFRSPVVLSISPATATAASPIPSCVGDGRRRASRGRTEGARREDGGRCGEARQWWWRVRRRRRGKAGQWRWLTGRRASRGRMDDARRGVCGGDGFCRASRWSSRGREGKEARWVRCAPGPPSSSTSSKSARSPRALAVARRSSPLVRGCADALGIEGALLPRGWRRSGSSEWARGSGPLVAACLAIARDAARAWAGRLDLLDPGPRARQRLPHRARLL